MYAQQLRFRITEQALKGDFHGLFAVADPDSSVLYGDVELHGAVGEGGQSPGLFGGNLPDVQVPGAVDFVGHAAPPLRGARGEAVDAGAARASAGLEEAALVGLAYFDPVLHLASEVLLPERWLLAVPHVLGKLERAVIVVGRRVQGEDQDANHHALVGFRGVAGNGEFMVRIDVAVHVGELDGGFVNGGLECHGRTVRHWIDLGSKSSGEVFQERGMSNRCLFLRIVLPGV